ncbi:peptidoglycan-binding protein [Pacificimonas sp. WHA3]|uniref:Peptidoglycan-binding protein n=1 Tax=Pacificimonas pallii TaxID=2827236 RepID=A0ABS6SJ66_9SPHN|nr:peptidoglycan-binding domain-containing protein [Pacificimonas pallii]MBV7257912.1 peptidoglycan-binding protein [Pacificimonas pallii]
MRAAWFVVVAGLLLALPAQAAAGDGKNRFAVKGAGALPCREFTGAMNSRNMRTAAAMGWFSGYLSAANRYEADTYELLPWQDPLYLTASITQFCKANPSMRLFEVAGRMVESLKPGRLKVASPRRTVANGETRIRLYAATIGRVKRALSTRDLLVGQVNAKADADLVASLAGFQKREGLEATGMPDQETLFRLLGK